MSVVPRRENMRLLLAARKSSSTRDKRQPITFEIQETGVEAWARANGHEIIGVAADIKSGVIAPWDRKNLRPWVTQPELMVQYDGIVAYKNDRLSRGCWADEARIRLWAEENRKALVISDGPQWPPRFEGEDWSWEAMAKQAYKEWLAAQRRNRDTRKALLTANALCNRPPWFYVSSGTVYAKTITPTKAGRVIVPEIFGRCIDGESTVDIATWVREQTGEVIWDTTIREIIRNPTYMGTALAGDGSRCPRCKAGEDCDSPHGAIILRCEPLVDASTWTRAGHELSSRPHRGRKNSENRAMLATAVFCFHCDDSPMYRQTARVSWGGYYRCTGRGPDKKGCGNSVRVDLADAAADRVIQESFAVPRMIPTVIPGNEAELKAALKAVEHELSRLGMRGLPDDEEDRQRSELRARREEIRNTPATEDRVELSDSGQVWSRIWKDTPDVERGPWLKRNGFRVTASKADNILVVSRDGRDAATVLS